MSDKKNKSNNIRRDNATQFKIWCIDNSIQQEQIRNDTHLSIGCIHSTWNLGKASPSTIKLLSLVYKIDEKLLKKMITTFVNKKNKKNISTTTK